MNPFTCILAAATRVTVLIKAKRFHVCGTTKSNSMSESPWKLFSYSVKKVSAFVQPVVWLISDRCWIFRNALPVIINTITKNCYSILCMSPPPWCCRRTFHVSGVGVFSTYPLHRHHHSPPNNGFNFRYDLNNDSCSIGRVSGWHRPPMKRLYIWHFILLGCMYKTASFMFWRIILNQDNI
jgi:hypothetical protein